MYYPTGKTTGNSCLICMDECGTQINEALCECNESCVLSCLENWLNEKNYCVECWQLNEYLCEKGYSARIDEDGVSAMPAPPPAAAPGGNYTTLDMVTGMGNPKTPQNDGTNAGFYDTSKVGSGDKFDSMTVGTAAAKKRRKAMIKKFKDFVDGKKM
jgi:hypothetical protein